MPSYRRLQQYAIAISVVSVLYNAAEGAVSIAFGAESASRALVFFGIQSGIEVASALLVIWRFRRVASPGEERGTDLNESALRFEKIATLSIGGLLVALALATEASSIAILALRQEPDSSNASLIISASALLIMVFIWLPKRYLARALDSSTMKGEATCSLSCIQITTVLFIGSLIYRVWKGGWWVDGATSLILGLLFGWEGVKMIRWARDKEFTGGCCKDCGPNLSTGPGDQPLKDQYHDICECCLTRPECQEAQDCKCADCSGSPDEAQGCCKPKSSGTEKCCTRKLIPGPRPSTVERTASLPKAGSIKDERAPPSDCSCC